MAALDCAKSWRSSPTPPNTTPPARRRARRTQFADVRRHRLDRRHGHLPFLCAGRPLHLAAEDPADQFLHLRLQLLHQPLVLERPPRPLHRRRGRAADARLLPAQLHRGPVPVVGRHPLARRDDGARWSRWRAACATTHEFRRLHPPEDHPGVPTRAGRAGRPLCRPPVDQCRAADRRGREAPGAGEEAGDDPAVDGAGCAAKHRGEGASRRCRRSGASASRRPASRRR